MRLNIVRDASACSFFAYDIRITMWDLMISDKICVESEERSDKRSETWCFFYIYHRVESLSVHQDSIFVSNFNGKKKLFLAQIKYSVVDSMSANRVSDNVTSRYAVPSTYAHQTIIIACCSIVNEPQ